GAAETPLKFSGLNLVGSILFGGASAAVAFIIGGLGDSPGPGAGSAKAQAGILALAGRTNSVNVSPIPSTKDRAANHQCTWSITDLLRSQATAPETQATEAARTRS